MPEENLKKLMNLEDALELRSQIYTWDTMPAVLKAYYNLGKYDTVSVDANGITTITRQTGYGKFKNLDWDYRSDWNVYYSDNLVGNTIYPEDWYTNGYIETINFQLTGAAHVGGHSGYWGIASDGRIYLYSNKITDGDVSALVNMFGNDDIQYKLPSPIIETVFTDNPIAKKKYCHNIRVYHTTAALFMISFLIISSSSIPLDSLFKISNELKRLRDSLINTNKLNIICAGYYNEGNNKIASVSYLICGKSGNNDKFGLDGSNSSASGWTSVEYNSISDMFYGQIYIQDSIYQID